MLIDLTLLEACLCDIRQLTVSVSRMKWLFYVADSFSVVKTAYLPVIVVFYVYSIIVLLAVSLYKQ